MVAQACKIGSRVKIKEATNPLGGKKGYIRAIHNERDIVFVQFDAPVIAKGPIIWGIWVNRNDVEVL